MNFNLALQSFEDQIAGVRKLVDISAAADRPIKLLATSSIGIANGWNPANGPVPERLLPDPEIAASTGYTASKYVVEYVSRPMIATYVVYMLIYSTIGLECCTGQWRPRHRRPHGPGLWSEGDWGVGHD